MARGFFITGTDTGVGKTVVAGALIRALHLLDLRVCGMKPVESGATRKGNVLIPRDGIFLKTVAKMNEKVSEITPYCFEAPLAPLQAAEIEKSTIDPRVIRKRFAVLSRKYDAIVAEGVGGLLVPISEGYSVMDMARDSGLPLIVVARPSLGTINHTLLTVWYALKEGLEVAGVIVNFSRLPEGTLAEDLNPRTLQRLLPVPLIGVFPHLAEISDESMDKAVLLNINMAIVKEALKR